ncbi:hypothetical protein GWO43_18625 [candidate division KSB1 bacterium]|nr:hypothetical protein [candidate division KSB1 bacterium]NIR70675.1 hypothetical protein [candidate division KSB1 bacterium]NIS26027.1 hypothetical protein [candidate division KSB1 bacterium]NIT72851.1 hypothetical protein [candidate division KSB1 bacterium]NIU26692.1 hypothetical protein [candidate division KSB1 bacterium]
MSLKHLTDKIIQEHLDDPNSPTSRRVQAHVEECHRCKKQLELYQNLFEELNADVGFELSASFSESVISRIKAESSSFGILSFGLAFMSLLVGLIATFYLTSLKSSLKSFAKIGAYLNLKIFLKLEIFLSDLNLDLELLGVAAFILIVISAIDHFVLQSRHKLLSS